MVVLEENKISNNADKLQVSASKASLRSLSIAIRKI